MEFKAKPFLKFSLPQTGRISKCLVPNYQASNTQLTTLGYALLDGNETLAVAQTDVKNLSRKMLPSLWVWQLPNNLLFKFHLQIYSQGWQVSVLGNMKGDP